MNPFDDFKTHEEIFAPQYTECSGPGSTLEFSKPYREFVERFILKHGLLSIYDLGCGDAMVGTHIRTFGGHYLGVDVIPERIERNAQLYPHHSFIVKDLRHSYPSADLVLVKDVIQHWSNVEIEKWLVHMKRCAFRFALVTNCCYGEVNQDIKTGGWRAVDLTKPPFETGEIVFSWGDPNKDVVLIKGLGE